MNKDAAKVSGRSGALQTSSQDIWSGLNAHFDPFTSAPCNQRSEAGRHDAKLDVSEEGIYIGLAAHHQGETELNLFFLGGGGSLLLMF